MLLRGARMMGLNSAPPVSDDVQGKLTEFTVIAACFGLNAPDGGVFNGGQGQGVQIIGLWNGALTEEIKSDAKNFKFDRLLSSCDYSVDTVKVPQK
ncbi:MAG: hypothetical protein ACRCSF_08365 [Mycobacteriaceae bacterium]